MSGKRETKVKNSKSIPDINPEHEEMAKEITFKYIKPNFNWEDIDFEIFTTMRYDPSLEIDYNEFNIEEDDEQKDKDFNIHENLNEFDIDFSSMIIIPSSQFFLFDEHLHRLQYTLKFFKWNFKLTKQYFLSKLNESIQYLDHNQPYRIKVTVNKKGELRVDVLETEVRPNLMIGLLNPNDQQTIWKVYIDSAPTLISPFTSFKTTKRDHYNESRKRTLNFTETIPPKDQEVLIYNAAGQIMEGSITNVAFKRKRFDEVNSAFIERWVTPPLSTGCLCGVVRHMLVRKNIVEEEPILLKDVKVGEEVLLFNSLMGVVKGIICEDWRKNIN